MHGYEFPLVRFELELARQKDKVRIPSQTINSEVYRDQVMDGPLRDAVNWVRTGYDSPCAQRWGRSAQDEEL
jgi:hypothetical protein